jgi:hypothetical protein
MPAALAARLKVVAAAKQKTIRGLLGELLEPEIVRLEREFGITRFGPENRAGEGKGRKRQ